MDEKEHTYKSYYVTVSGFNLQSEKDSSAVPGRTVSKCVESFLQDKLKNKKIKVLIEEHFTTVHKI